VAPESSKKPSGRHQGLIEALASLAVAQVEEAMGRLPEGGAGMEEPEVIRRVFLELRKKG
jgi:hypothetical protein